MTLRARLVAAVTALTFITLGVAFIAVSVAVNHAQQRRLDAALLAEAELDAEQTALLDGEGHVIDDMPMPAAHDVGPLLKYGAIYDKDGRIRARTTSFGRDVPALSTIRHPPHEPFDFWRGTDHLRGVFVPFANRPQEVLLLAAQRAELDGDAAFLRRAMTIAFVVAVSWTAAVATWVVRRLTRDHEKIAEVAHRVAGGDLSARVRPRPGEGELAKLGRNIDEMIERLEVLVESQQRFIALAAHELRSPLTTVYGQLSHALRRSRDADAYRLAIEEALDSTRNLKSLADDLLTLARIGSDRPPMTTPVSLVDVMRSAVPHVLPHANQRTVDIAIEGQDCTVLGDARDLERMVRNLLENAVRHSPERGRVVASATMLVDRIKLTVSDEGPGIPVEERETIFEPFYRSRGDGDSDGAGLGLAIVRQIARTHGGDARHADTGSIKGAHFEVLLPKGPDGVPRI